LDDKREARAEGGRRFQRERPITEKDLDMDMVVLVQGTKSSRLSRREYSIRAGLHLPSLICIRYPCVSTTSTIITTPGIPSLVLSGCSLVVPAFTAVISADSHSCSLTCPILLYPIMVKRGVGMLLKYSTSTQTLSKLLLSYPSSIT